MYDYNYIWTIYLISIFLYFINTQWTNQENGNCDTVTPSLNPLFLNLLSHTPPNSSPPDSPPPPHQWIDKLGRVYCNHSLPINYMIINVMIKMMATKIQEVLPLEHPLHVNSRITPVVDSITIPLLFVIHQHVDPSLPLVVLSHLVGLLWLFLALINFMKTVWTSWKKKLALDSKNKRLGT